MKIYYFIAIVIFLCPIYTFGDIHDISKVELEQVHKDTKIEGHFVEDTSDDDDGGYYGDFDDVKFIICDTCKALIHESIDIVANMRQATSNGEVRESEIELMLESICYYKSDYGKWIDFYNIFRAEDHLELLKQKRKSNCMSDIRTIELACDTVIRETIYKLAKKLFKNNSSEDEYVKEFCVWSLKDVPGACRNPHHEMPGFLKIDDISENKESEREITEL